MNTSTRSPLTNPPGRLHVPFDPKSCNWGGTKLLGTCCIPKLMYGVLLVRVTCESVRDAGEAPPVEASTRVVPTLYGQSVGCVGCPVFLVTTVSAALPPLTISNSRDCPAFTVG